MFIWIGGEKGKVLSRVVWGGKGDGAKILIIYRYTDKPIFIFTQRIQIILKVYIDFKLLSIVPLICLFLFCLFSFTYLFITLMSCCLILSWIVFFTQRIKMDGDLAALPKVTSEQNLLSICLHCYTSNFLLYRSTVISRTR